MKDFNRLEDTLKLKLQLFAGDDGGEGDEGKGKEPDKTYSQEELDKLLQAEADKRVTDALKKAQDKFEKEYAAKLEAEKAEAERLAKLSADEKEKALIEKTRAEIAEKERALIARELELKTVDMLNEKSLPLDFKEFVLGGDEDKTVEKIERFSKLFNDSLEKAISEKLKGNPPGKGIDDPGKGIKNPWSKDSFNLTEQGRILREDPELAKLLKSQA